MLKKILLATVFILLLTATAHAKEGTAIIYGAVHDNLTPLAGAQITIIGEATYTSRSTVTNEHGVYFIDKLPADEYIIRAIPQPAGVYKDGSANVYVGKGARKEINFPLKKK